MQKINESWTELYPDFKFTNLSEFKYISSPNVPFVVIQFRLKDDSLQSIRESMKESMKKDYLAQNGLYFLRLRDGYYIGETKDLNERLSTHIKNKEIDSITIATYKSEEDALNKDGVRDLESLLLQYAIETGMVLGKKLKNTKKEGRKLQNALDMRQSEKSAKYIWDKITYLNIRDILEETKSRLISNDENSAIENPQSNKEKSTAKNRKLTGATTRLYEKGIIRKVDMVERIKNYDLGDPFLKLVPKTANPASGYIKDNNEMFTKEYSKNALLEYLFSGNSVVKTDEIITEGERKKGWLTAVTLAYLGIKTNGEALGIMKEMKPNDAKELIDHFIERQL